MSNQDIRKQARQALKQLPGKYQLFLIPLVLLFFSTGIQAYTKLQLQNLTEQSLADGSGLKLLLSPFPLMINILLILFTLSAAYTMLEVVRKQRQEVSYQDSTRTFTGKTLLNLFLLYLAKTLLLTPWSILIFFSYILLIFGLLGLTAEPFVGVGSLLVILALIGLVVGVVFLIIKSYTYSQAEYILFDWMTTNQTIDPFQLIQASKELMAGHKMNYFSLQLSFIGWHLLSVLTLGLLYIYVFPYELTARTVFYQHLWEKRGLAQGSAQTQVQ